MSLSPLYLIVKKLLFWDALNELEKLINVFNERRHLYNLSVAYGYALFTHGNDEDIWSIYKKADKKMYAYKKNQKKLILDKGN